MLLMRDIGIVWLHSRHYNKITQPLLYSYGHLAMLSQFFFSIYLLNTCWLFFFCAQFNRNWFLPEEASLKRAHIRKLICEILEDQSKQLPKGESVDKYPCSHFASTNEEETGVEFLTVEYSSLKMCEGHLSSPNTELGNEITHTSASSLSVVPQKLKEPGLESREFEPETSARLFYSRNCSRACHQSFTSPVEVITCS